MEIEIEIYEDKRGKKPFHEWLKQLKELRTKSKILTRIDRLKFGNFGDCKVVGEGVFELRIHYGPGFRVYYSKIGKKIILLLCGGDKGTQSKDINRAKEYLVDYQKQGGKDGSK